MARILLHIGTEKTGSSFLQRWLDRNASTLLNRHGILYPRHRALNVGGAHHPLSAALLPETECDFLAPRRHRPLPELIATLEQQIQRYQPTCVVLSAEHLSSRLDIAAITQLRDSLDGHNVSILAYFRWQDEMALSHFSTDLRCGLRDWFDPKQIDPSRRSYCPWKLADDWAGVFGQENLQLVDFHHACSSGLANDICQRMSIDNEGFAETPPRNQRINLLEARLLHRLNQRLPPWDELVADGQTRHHSRAMRLRNSVLETFRKRCRDQQHPSPALSTLLSPAQRNELLECFQARNQAFAERFGLTPPTTRSQQPTALKSTLPATAEIEHELERCLLALGIAPDRQLALARLPRKPSRSWRRLLATAKNSMRESLLRAGLQLPALMAAALFTANYSFDVAS